MKTTSAKKLSRFVLAFMLGFGIVQSSFAQKNIPYPIIFVHGLNSDYSTWGTLDTNFDNVLDFLHGAGLNYGGNLNISLSYKRSSTTLSVSKEQDVSLLNQPIAGDFYTINFNVHANGFVPVVHKDLLGAVIYPTITDLLGISSTATQFSVSLPDEFVANDIICVDNEFMQVTNVDGNNLTVVRGVCNSNPTFHIPTPLDNLIVYNLSNESNQASIAKQGYALKLAIDAVKKANPGVQKVILVGHSMGGLAAREYIRSNFADDVAKIVTIGTPHGGADITELPNSILRIIGVDGKSDAVRDLRATINNNLGTLLFGGNDQGIYLFGGYENTLSGFHDNDINANGTENDLIFGLNDNFGRSTLKNIARTWITSSLDGAPTDGVVPLQNQFLPNSIADTLKTNRSHLGEPSDYYTLLRGLDEPDSPSLAYEIGQNSSTTGFITFTQGNALLEENPTDVDLYKINITSHSQLTVSITASVYTGINTINLLNADQTVRKSISHITQSITDELNAGTYYIQVNGTATHGSHSSYQYPYTLTTTTSAILPSSITSLPDKSLNYYDVVSNQYRDTTIQLTNNSSADLNISNIALTGANADQFSITSPSAFVIPAGKKQNITVRFKPTSSGVKNATLTISNNSSDVPNKSLSLQGNGTSHATKNLNIRPDLTYNFGNKTITENTAEAFTMLNTGSNNVTISGLSISGVNASDFFISKPFTPPYNVGSNGDSSVFIVNFKPGTIGAKTAKLIIASNADNKSPADTVTLYGNGTNSIYTGISGSITASEYWFDNNYAGKVSTSVNSQNLSYINTKFPTTGLVTGTHYLHIRYQDKNGAWSSVTSQNFYKASTAPDSLRKIVSYEYWFDNNYNTKTSVSVTARQTAALNDSINTVSLPVGQHSLHLRYMDDNGQWSTVMSSNFYKTNITFGVNSITSYRYWFDTDNKHLVTVNLPAPVSIYTLSANITATGLPDGNHTIHFQFKDHNNAWSSVTNDTAFFHAVALPTITSFTPVNGGSGTIVTITGTNFTGTTAISFGGIAATAFTVVSPTSINATVGSGASGAISVTTPGGTVSFGTFSFSQPSTISFSAIPSKTYGAADFDPSAIASSGLPVSYSSSNILVATIVNGKVHIIGAGTTNIIASANGITATQLLTVLPATLTITANNQTKITGQPNPVFTMNYSGFVNGEDSTKLVTLPVASSTAVISSPVGTYPISVSGASAVNYVFNYISGVLTVKPVPTPTISSFNPANAIPGTTVTITGANFTGTSVVSFGGTTATSFNIVSPTSIIAVVGSGTSGNVSVTTPGGTATLAGFKFTFNLPPTNFGLSATSATCKGTADGSINITALQNLNYTAVITGNGVNSSYPFTTTQVINNLAAGTYHVCITVQGQASYQQCYDMVITEPKDLSLYSTVNTSLKTLTLNLDGANTYNILLNGTLYTTSNNSITIPLKGGVNNLSVSTDKFCQGTIEKVINISETILPFPDPFQNTLNINLGYENIANLNVEIHTVSDGRLVYAKQYSNLAGILQLDVSTLNGGVYALHLKMGNTEKIFKILKK